jgi:hypothetical protein
MYLNVRRVNDSLAFLHLSLAQQTTVTQGRTIAGGVEVKGDLLGMGLSGIARREVAEQISQIHLLGDLDRYLKLHDLLEVREVPDGSRRTLEQQTFWEFPLVGVDVPVPDPDADALHAVGRLDRLDLPVWFRIDNEWRRQPVREFRGTLTVVAQAVEEPPPADLEPFLQGGDGPAALRLRPLAIHR